MKAIDTKVFASFFVNDHDNPEAAKQRPAAIQVMTGRAFVSLKVTHGALSGAAPVF